MEYAKDEIFNIRYNSLKGTLEYGTSSNKKKIRKFIKKHKVVFGLSIVAIILSISNIIMIINFINEITKIAI